MKKNTILLLTALSILYTTYSYSQVTLCGATSKGGNREFGTVFTVTSNGNLTTLVKFDSNNGANPYSNAILASDGNLYGTTVYGGINDSCVVYRYNQDSGTLTVLLDFDTAGLDDPYGQLIQGKDGNLYGMTTGRGLKNYYGSIYEITLAGKLIDLYNFNYYDGGWPNGNLLQAADGNFYGMTYAGGDSNASEGTLFQFTPSGILTTLVKFTGGNGMFPNGGLIQDTDGYLYGMTTYGGVNQNGNIFKCSTTGNITTIHYFNSNDGGYPYGNLVIGKDGYLYGMTQYGGDSNSGVIFKCSTSGNYYVLTQFEGSNGANPYGNLIQASDGNFYGMTSSGGLYGGGTIFELNAQNDIITLVNFNDSDGASPYYGSLTELTKPLAIANVKNTHNISVFPNPFHNSTTVQVNTNGNHYLEVDDLTGRKIESLEFTGKQYQLSSQGLAQGMCFIRVFNENNVLIGTSKIVVQ